jgi:hypothetical protein
VRDFVAGKVRLTAIWPQLKEYTDRRSRQAGVDSKWVTESFHGSFEFLYACRAIQAKKLELCDELSLFSSDRVVRCRLTAAFFGDFLTEALASKRCEPATLARFADRGLSAAQVQGLCEALAQRNPAKCPKAPFLGVACEAWAGKKPELCKSVGAGPDKSRAQADCRSDLTGLDAIAARDVKKIRGKTDWTAFAAATLGARGWCEPRFLEDITRRLPPGP